MSTVEAGEAGFRTGCEYSEVRLSAVDRV